MASVRFRFSEAGSWSYSQVHPGPLSESPLLTASATVAGTHIADVPLPRPASADGRPNAVRESAMKDEHRETNGQYMTDHPGGAKAVYGEVDRILPEKEWSISNMKNVLHHALRVDTPIRFGDVLLLMYRQFMPAEELLSFLLSSLQPVAGTLTAQCRGTRLKASSLLLRWIRRFSYDDLSAAQMKHISASVSKSLSDLPAALHALLYAIAKYSRRNHTKLDLPPHEELSSDLLRSMRPGALARHLAHIHQFEFSMLEPLHVVKGSSKQLSTFADGFNRLSFVVANSILTGENLVSRTKNMQFWIEVACASWKFKDFHACFSVMAGLELHPIYRLRQLRNTIDGRHKRSFTQLRSWTSSKDNFSEYRQEFSSVLLQRQSCVPHLAVHLRDLVGLHQVIELRKSHCVPISRLESVLAITERLISARQPRYSGEVDKASWGAIITARSLAPSEETLLKLSRSIEGKMSPKSYRRWRLLNILEDSGFN